MLLPVDENNIQDSFYAIAKLLFNEYVLNINGTQWNLREIEFY